MNSIQVKRINATDLTIDGARELGKSKLFSRMQHSHAAASWQTTKQTKFHPNTTPYGSCLLSLTAMNEHA